MGPGDKSESEQELRNVDAVIVCSSLERACQRMLEVIAFIATGVDSTSHRNIKVVSSLSVGISRGRWEVVLDNSMSTLLPVGGDPKQRVDIHLRHASFDSFRHTTSGFNFFD